MAVTLQHQRDNIYRVEITGRLRKLDLDAAQRPLTTEIRRVGNVRLLVVLTHFLGWADDAGWQELGFYVRYGDHIERIAIVGDERWRGEALMFVAADLRKAPVTFFTGPGTDEARVALDIARHASGTLYGAPGARGRRARVSSAPPICQR